MQNYNSLILYGCETCLLIFKDGLRMFENRVLRLIFGPKKGEVTEDGR
jgi:hypothetical protein